MNIKAGLETIFEVQNDDSFITVLKELYVNLKNITIDYNVNGVITKGDYEEELNTIIKTFKEDSTERFGTPIILRSSNTFAVMPIMNMDTMKSGMVSFKKDSKKAMKQINDFKKWISKNELEIDIKNIKINNLPDGFYFPLFIDIKSIYTTLEEEEFIAIILHEVGHIFTLLEMYSKTTDTISKLIDSYLKDFSLDKTITKLKITTNPSDTKSDTIYKIYEAISDDMGITEINNGKSNDFTDSEYEADNFVALFGYSAYLTTAINKLTDIGALKYRYLPFYLLFVFLLDILISLSYLFVILVITGTAAQGLALIFMIVNLAAIAKIVTTMYTTIEAQGNRNPTGDEHGDVMTRYKKIRIDILKIVRTQQLDKKELNALIKQLDIVDNSITEVEQTLLSSLLGSLISPLFNININTREQLVMLIDNLINNEQHLMASKFKNGLEYMRENVINVSNTKYYTEVDIWSDYIKKLLIGNITALEKINNKINKYGLRLFYNNTKLMIESNSIVNIKSGISGFGVWKMKGNTTDVKSVVSITIDSDKVVWQLLNPYIKVYDIDYIEVNKVKNMYIMELEYLSPVLDKKQTKEVYDIGKALDSIYTDIGIKNIDDTISAYFKYFKDNKIKLSKEVEEQFNLIKEVINKLDFKDRALTLDLHKDNWGINEDKKLVMFDPIYDRNGLALETNNKIDLKQYSDNLSK